MKLKRGFLVSLVAATSLWSVSVLAVPIPGLFNTGVDAAGNPLVGGNGVIDPHYVIVSGPGATIYPVSAVTFNCCYFPDQPAGTNGNSRWISVNANGSAAGSGSYLFQTTFSLTGLDPATASISGLFAADNGISQTSINGNVVSGATSPGFGSYTAFSVPVGSGFAAGLNTLSFLVDDAGAPMSLRVDSLAGTADLINGGPGPGTGVPEPSSILLLAMGIAALGVLTRRRSRSAYGS